MEDLKRTHALFCNRTFRAVLSRTDTLDVVEKAFQKSLDLPNYKLWPARAKEAAKTDSERAVTTLQILVKLLSVNIQPTARVPRLWSVLTAQYDAWKCPI